MVVRLNPPGSGEALVATHHKPGRDNLTGRINGWKTILNTLTIHYGDRLNGTY